MTENPEEKQTLDAPADKPPQPSATEEKRPPHPNRDKVEFFVGIALGALILLDWLLTWMRF